MPFVPSGRENSGLAQKQPVTIIEKHVTFTIHMGLEKFIAF
jgi:hypothetical protein